MTILIYAIILIIGVFLGVIGYVKSQKIKVDNLKRKQEIDNYSKLECAECDMPTLLKEWEVTINTQMHFNDLIIKFRSIVLSVFIASLGFIYGLTKQLGLANADFLLLISLAFTFWLCSFFLDYFYYHKLLIGAVYHATKFDENDFFKNKGLFGLTRRINYEIEASKAKVLIWFFYLMPIIALLGVLLYKNFKII